VSDYVELRCKSAFSFLQAASAPEDLVSAAAGLDMDCLALADRDGLYGAPRFYQAAREAGLHPVVGAEVGLDTGSSLLLLVENERGYKNLCRLISVGHSGRPKGESLLRIEQLEPRCEGLLCLTGDALDADLQRGEGPGLLDRLRGMFGPRSVWVEIGRHFDRREARLNEARCALAERAGARLVATNDVRYARRQKRRLQDVMTCIREKVRLDTAGRLLQPNAERYLKSAGQMSELFSDLPRAVHNTREVAARCAFDLGDLDYRFPDFPVPEGETAFSFLHRLVQQGARHRYRPISARHMQQLTRELALIDKLELAGYFLLVWDLCRYCREKGILVQGRGSAANSAVCYVLGITAVDPVGMDLLFERFLSEERGQWPDIDLDLPSGDQREKVIQYVYERYTRRGAAMTANVITYRLRSAVREVGKVLGIEERRLTRLLVACGGGGIEPAAAAKEAGLAAGDRRVRLLLELGEEIRHLPRHLGQHSGGMVIAAGRLDEVVPVEPASMAGRTVIQWDKDDCADMGIIKVDLLGLGMLKVLEEAIPLIRRQHGIELDLARLPPDDAEVYAMLGRADTVGVFQVESRAQMNTLPRLKPRRFYDLVVEVAIIRPGPIVGKKVHPYLERRAGREPISYPHPSLKPILERTLGIPLFQEQAMRIAMEAAGYSVGQAEQLRQAMSHRRSAEQKALHEERLAAGLARRGITGRAAEEIIASFSSFFGLYGFPESHAASFALIVYASAYLKAHYPAAFTCALLNAWPMGFYNPATIVKDAKRHGQTVRGFDVAHSAWRCGIEPDGAVRLGLRFVLGLREQTAQRIEAARGRGPFRDVKDLQARCGLRQNELNSLAELGALGSLGLGRRAALWQVASLETSERGLLARLSPPADRSPLARMSAAERTAADYRNAGLTVGPHPITHLRDELRRRGVLPAASLGHKPDGARVRVAGQVIARQRPPTAKGMCFITLEDESGFANVVVTPDRFAAHRRALVTSRALIVSGRLERREGVINVRGESFEPLGEAGDPAPRSRDFH